VIFACLASRFVRVSPLTTRRTNARAERRKRRKFIFEILYTTSAERDIHKREDTKPCETAMPRTIYVDILPSLENQDHQGLYLYHGKDKLSMLPIHSPRKVKSELKDARTCTIETAEHGGEIIGE
jgi:hypothetical protein